MRIFKSALLAGALAAGVMSAAQATPINGTFGLTIYQGPGNGNIADPNNQANQANPLIAPATELGAGTYTGSINFALQSGSDTISNFLATGGGTLSSALQSGINGKTLSTGNFGLSTVFVFTGNTGGATLGGSFSHDDGASLYDGINFATTVAASPSPTVDIPTSFSGLNGSWELIYVEANGLPADLTFDVTSAVPEPASLVLFGSALAGLGLMRRRGKRSLTA